MLFRRLKYMDKWLLFPYLIIAIFSIVMVYSASTYSALQDFGNAAYYLPRQALFVVLGIGFALFTALFPLNKLKNKKIVIFSVIVTFAMLVYVLLFTEAINGARSWIPTPLFNIQPSEIAKVVVIWYLAYILSKKQHVLNETFFKSIVQPCLLIGFMVLLIFMQPDTGGAFILVTIAAVMILASGIPPKYGLGVGTLGITSIVGGLYFIRRFGEQLPFLDGYRLARFQAFWDPFALSESYGLQLVNSYYALSRGGLTGVGLGNSIQKTGYLPFPYTDFIVAIVGEELGLIGIIGLLALFALLVSRIYLIGIRSRDSFNSILCIGIGTLFFIQAFLNIGGVVGLIPITGLTFPFLSYGGSSMMVMSIAIGLVLNVSIREKLGKYN